MKLAKDGFELTFTEPVDEQTAADPASYLMSTYAYEYREQYGSPEVDPTEATIMSAVVAADAMSVRLQVEGLERGHVHELHADGVKSKTSLPLLHAEAYYTVNRLIND